MQVIVNGLAASYQRSGSGKLVVIVPGWADVAANWHAFAAQLAGSYEVIVLDMPGFGGSQAPAVAWGLDDYANFIAQLLHKLDGKPVAIIGHSNGGAIAIRGLATNVLTSDKLVLLASAGIRNEASGRKGFLKAVAKTGKVLSAPLPTKTRKQLRAKFYDAAGSDLLVAEHMQETFKKVVGQDVQADAAQLALPTLLIYGEQDDQTPVGYGQRFHELIAAASLEILPHADHFLYQSQATQVTQLVEDFLG